jgi:hypothetical protein
LKALLVVVTTLSAASGAAQCLPAPTPLIAAPPVAQRTQAYAVTWDGTLSATPNFELQEATNASFSDATTIAVSNALTRTIAAHTDATAEKRYFYRVRGIASCNGQAGPYSATASTIVTATPSASSSDFVIGVPAGTTQPFTIDYLVPGLGETATSEDRFNIVITGTPWLTVFPQTGALSAGGTTIQFTVNPTGLTAGTNLAAISLERTQVGVRLTLPVTLSASLTPSVTPQPRQALTPANTLIIPRVEHDGSTRTQSDVRLLNTGSTTATYDVAFTPEATNGTVSGKKFRIDVAANETKALDDVVRMFFGETGAGTIEIRQSLTAPPALATSRTYTVTSAGSRGQFVPALARTAFIAPAAFDGDKITLGPIAFQSGSRTDFGFVEGNGQAAQINVKLLDAFGAVLQLKPLSLQPFEHRQLSLTDPTLFPSGSSSGVRVEIEVTSSTGLVSAYASIVDTKTSDTMLVPPVQPRLQLASRVEVPGVAELSGVSTFHSDLYIHNAGSSAADFTISFRPQRGDSSPALQAGFTMLANQVFAVPDILPATWALFGSGGAITIATQNGSPVPLVVNGRTYSGNATNGTFSQFIPGVRDAPGAGERAVEILQLEESANFRSNLGLSETTGHAAVIEITGYAAGVTTAPALVLQLEANEFRQLRSVFRQLGIFPALNGRIRVRVLSGTGRVAAYGSMIDSRSGDPTYVPAQ